MINPGRLPQSGPAGKLILGGAVYSLICCYCALRALRRFAQGDADRLMRYMSAMLCVLGALFVFLASGARLSALMEAIASLRAGNAGNEQLLGTSYWVLGCGFVADALPYALDIMVVFAALRLAEAFRADRYSPETAGAAERLSKICVKALTISVLVSAAYNLLQVLLMDSLHVINVTVSIPALSIAFVLAALLLARLIASAKALKDENDAFI